jgi:hypothetical protein
MSRQLGLIHVPHQITVMSEQPCAVRGEPEGGRTLTEGDVVEVPLLLPGWQVSGLETAAHQRGLTAASMVRNLIRDFIAAMVPPGRAV